MCYHPPALLRGRPGHLLLRLAAFAAPQPALAHITTLPPSLIAALIAASPV